MCEPELQTKRNKLDESKFHETNSGNVNKQKINLKNQHQRTSSTLKIVKF